MSGRLQNKIVIVTGGGAGFGRSIVEKFVLEGAKVLIWDVHPTSANQLAMSLPEGSCISFVGDVSKIQDWEEALQTVLDKWGMLDVVVNNAGVSFSAFNAVVGLIVDCTRLSIRRHQASS
jgi:NAD(P)-dependent dehydrogenase (short-subunit alcohol dehydrogenase family)